MLITAKAKSIEKRKRNITKIIRQHLISGDLSRAFQLTNTSESYEFDINIEEIYKASHQSKD